MTKINDTWTELLKGKNIASSVASAVTTMPEVTISPLSHQTLLKISGTDSEKFLQGQLTCDLQEITQDTSRLGAHCNNKGAIATLMRVIKKDDSFLLRMNQENSHAALALFKKYIIFSKATIEHLESSWVGFGISGPNSEKLLASLFSQLPEQTDQHVSENNCTLVKVPGDRYELWLPLEQAKTFCDDEEATLHFVTLEHWIKEEILNAIPDIYPQSRESFIPQMCNLQVFSAVSFKKGCYTGQEVVTRLHFRGKLTKHLCTAKITTSTQQPTQNITIGDKVNCQERDNIGEVIQAVTIANETFIQMIVNKKFSQDHVLFINDVQLEAIDLPYTLDPSLFERKS